jgi:hypothetical protein
MPAIGQLTTRSLESDYILSPIGTPHLRSHSPRFLKNLLEVFSDSIRLARTAPVARITNWRKEKGDDSPSREIIPWVLPTWELRHGSALARTCKLAREQQAPYIRKLVKDF